MGQPGAVTDVAGLTDNGTAGAALAQHEPVPGGWLCRAMFRYRTVS